MNPGDRGHGIARRLIACVGLLILAAGLLFGGLSAGAALTEVLGFLLTLASLAAPSRTDAPLSEEDLAAELESLVRRRWSGEASTRRLIDRDFVPLSFLVLGSTDTGCGRAAGADPGPAFWSTKGFREAALALYRSVPGGQLVVIGERGSGKSVLSLMLTLAIAGSKADAGLPELPIPLPVSISSWRPASEDFARWFERRMLRDYPVIRRTPSSGTGNGPVWDAIFSTTRKCLPILDGLDEIPPGQRDQAVEQLAKYFPEGAPFVLLSRNVSSLHGGLLDGVERLIAPVPAETAARYFEHLHDAHGVPAAQMTAVLRSPAKGNLRDLLQRPLYLDLARKVLQEHQVTQAQLIAASDEGEQAFEDFLISWNLRYLLQFVRSGGPRNARHLVFFAKQMTSHEASVLPWWRLADCMPADVLIASITVLIAIPAYLLALRMPAGLTRGLAIGVIAGISFGMLRGRPVRWADLSLVSVFLPLTLAIEGWCAVGPRQGLADAIEISTAAVLAIGYRAVLFKPPFEQQKPAAADQESACSQPGPPLPSASRRRGDFLRGVRATRPWHPLAMLTGIGLATTASTALVSGLMHFHDPQRTPVTIFMASSFGVGIAAAAARLLIVSPDRMEPSTVLLRWGHRVGGLAGPAYAGMFSAVIVGVGGGFTGGLRLGLTYGVMLAIVFGLIVGIPVGLVGTAIRWLSSPEVETATEEGANKGRKRAAPSTLRTDRTVTVATVLGIGGAAAAGISTLIFIPQFHVVTEVISQQSSFGILPADGILFGLTIGLIVACFNTAWPTYALAHCWLVLTGRSPIRLERFLDELHHAQILRREGSYLMFRHYEFQRYLSEHGDEFALMPPPRPSRRQREPVACLPARFALGGLGHRVVVRDADSVGADIPVERRRGVSAEDPGGAPVGGQGVAQAGQQRRHPGKTWSPNATVTAWPTIPVPRAVAGASPSPTWKRATRPDRSP